MSEHLADVVAYVSGEDESELGRTKAELGYALHSLERELAIAQSMQEQNEALRKALTSASAQCGNVIYNCEQRPASNERHLASWRGVKEFIDRALGVVGGLGR